MKNRDNEFFREEELDELVEKRDYETLRDKMSRIFACPCCLNGFKHVENISKFFQKRKSGKHQHLQQQKLLFRLFTGIWKRRRNMLHM